MITEDTIKQAVKNLHQKDKFHLESFLFGICVGSIMIGVVSSILIYI